MLAIYFLSIFLPKDLLLVRGFVVVVQHWSTDVVFDQFDFAPYNGL